MLTEEQQAVIEASKVLQPRELLKIEACAGSGKTFTLQQAAEANPDKRFLYLAFNKAIVEEAKRRFPPNVEISTVHSLAWRWFAAVYGRQALKNLKGSYNVFDLRQLFNVEYAELTDLIAKFRAFCYSAAAEPTDRGVGEIFDAIKAGKLPPTHDFYLKLYQIECGNRFKEYDYVLLDEAQDTNPVTMALFADNNCRKILVGDSHQAIYAFRGAVNALEKAPADITLNLSYSFRSVQPILDRANFFLQSLSVDKEHFIPMKSMVKSVRKIVSRCAITRTNAGIITRINDLSLSDLEKCRLLRPAAAIFGCALSLLAFKQRRPERIFKEYSWLKQFESFGDIARYAEDCHDEEILANMRLADSYGNHLYTLYKRAELMAFNDEATDAICTAHTAKGLEWDQVTVEGFVDLREARNKIAAAKLKEQSGYAMTPQEFQQELNLYYVALTRARYLLEDATPNDKVYQQRAGASETPRP